MRQERWSDDSVREGFGCLELSNEKVDWSSVKIKGKAGKADILVGVCSRPPNQDEEADELFSEVLAHVLWLQALVFVEVFNLLDVCWKQHSGEETV